MLLRCDDNQIPDYAIADETPPAHLYWLWPSRIPLGRLTLLVGDPGVGKTLLAADLAARISAGLPWPDAVPPDPDAVEFCPEPLAEGEDERCPIFNRARETAAALPAVPDNCAPAHDQVHPRGNPFPTPVHAPPGDSPTTHEPAADVLQTPLALKPRRCRDFPLADLLGCPYRMLPESGEQINHPLRRKTPLPHLGVLFVCPEDPDSLRPRLRAAGADLGHICILNGVSPPEHSARILAQLKNRAPRDFASHQEVVINTVCLPANLAALSEAANVIDHTCLIIVDPLQAILPPPGQGGPNGLAAALAALTDFARQRGVAVVGICHLAKSNYLRTIYRVHGSIALSGVARAIHLLSADPDQHDRRILFPIKTVYGSPPKPVAFRIVAPGRLDWQTSEYEAPGRLSCLCSEQLNASPEAHSVLNEACDWLAASLSSGPRRFCDLMRDATAAGLSLRTLRRAKRLLAVRSIVLPDHSGWLWSIDLPTSAAVSPKAPQPPEANS